MPSGSQRKNRGKPRKYINRRIRRAIHNAPLAQLVEQLTLNQWAAGSSPSRCTKIEIGSKSYRFLFWFCARYEGVEGREVGGIYRRQNSGYPLFSVRVRSRRESLKVHQKGIIRTFYSSRVIGSDLLFYFQN